MKYSVALFAGIAAAGYIPAGSWPAAEATTSSSSPAADYWPKPSSTSSSTSSSSSAAGYWSKSEETWPTPSAVPSYSWGSETWGSETWSSETSETPSTWAAPTWSETAAPVKPTYAPAPAWPAGNATTPTWAPSASPVSTSGPVEVTANAAVNNVAGAGAGLAGVFAAVAYLL